MGVLFLATSLTMCEISLWRRIFVFVCVCFLLLSRSLVSLAFLVFPGTLHGAQARAPDEIAT